MEVKIVNKSPFKLPEYATIHSAGMDMRANLTESMVIQPLHRVMVPTGIYIQLPDGYEAQIRPRSGLAARNGIGIVNSPGTIDADYRGEIKIILVNLSNEPFTLNPGERVAQMVIARYKKAVWKECDTLDESERGEGGFGST
ncbi:MAG: deoxyuridine 5'-triphosphate nucleotidohydrolase, partial [Bacteroidetes bacterium RIFOXYC2_FULL_39_11]